MVVEAVIAPEPEWDPGPNIVMAVADELLITMSVGHVTVKLVKSFALKTVPVPVSVHVAGVLVMDLVIEPVVVILATVNAFEFISNVPLVSANEPVMVSVSNNCKLPPPDPVTMILVAVAVEPMVRVCAAVGKKFRLQVDAEVRCELPTKLPLMLTLPVSVVPAQPVRVMPPVYPDTARVPLPPVR
jgi:hypothetical protein